MPSTRRLSEISHLFLSDVRKKQTGTDARPTRTPPGSFKSDVSVDMTPEEFADMMRPASLSIAAASRELSLKAARVVIAHHLGEAMVDRVRDLAATLGNGSRIGVIYADAGNVRVCCVDPAATDAGEEAASESLDPARLREVLVELDEDVAEWLLVLPDPRSTEGRALLAGLPNWTLLSGVDHEAIVAAYRTLKGVCEEARPAVTVCVFDATDGDEADKTFRKLAGVCEQFLKLPVAAGPTVMANDGVVEHCLLDASAADHGPADHGPADAGHWAVLGELKATDATPPSTAPMSPSMPEIAMTTAPRVSRQIPVSAPAAVEATVSASVSPVVADDFEPIYDLPDADASPAAILRAVVRGGTEFVASPVKAPCLPDATVAVSRDRRLVLLAVARQGLGELKAVGAAYRWMLENRALIAMATPQFAVDAHAEPRLHLLIDRADAAADALQPLLAAGSVSVCAYRKLRWGAKTGLMLEAA